MMMTEMNKKMMKNQLSIMEEMKQLFQPQRQMRLRSVENVEEIIRLQIPIRGVRRHKSRIVEDK